MTVQTHLSAGAIAFAGLALSLLPSQGFAANPTAAQSTTTACSAQYQAAKSAGTLGGKTWPQFLSDCGASLKASAAAPATATPTKAAPRQKQANAAAPAATASAATGHQTTQQICSGQYQAAKAGGTLAGQTWPQFLKACGDSIKNDKEDVGAAPQEPTQATTGADQPWTAPTASASGKQLSPGQIAFRQRIHECSTEWQGEKSAGTLPAGAKWPQFWSACNTRLKAQG